MIIGGVILLSVVVLAVFLGKVFVKSQKSGTESILPTEVVEKPIPTIDSSVNVSLTKSADGKEISLIVAGIPKGTKSVDYELSYDTEKQGIQGVIGTIKIDGEKSLEKQLTLGTCSSGTCVYHKVTGPIKLNLRFSGEYGEKTFEKEVSL